MYNIEWADKSFSHRPGKMGLAWGIVWSFMKATHLKTYGLHINDLCRVEATETTLHILMQEAQKEGFEVIASLYDSQWNTPVEVWKE